MKKAIVAESPPVPSGERRRRFEDVYTANCGPVLGYLLRRTASSDDAADALAETFLIACWRLWVGPASGAGASHCPAPGLGSAPGARTPSPSPSSTGR